MPDSGSELEEGEIPPEEPLSQVTQAHPRRASRSPPPKRRRSRSPAQPRRPPRDGALPRRGTPDSSRRPQGRTPPGSGHRQPAQSPSRRSGSGSSRQRRGGSPDSPPRDTAATLASDVKQLTSDTGLAKAMRSLDSVCRQMLSAVDKLSKLQALEKEGSNGLGQQQAPLLAKGMFVGLRSVHVAMNTAQGLASDLAPARQLFDRAMAVREALFSEAQCQTLMKWVSSSKALRAAAEKANGSARAASTPVRASEGQEPDGAATHVPLPPPEHPALSPTPMAAQFDDVAADSVLPAAVPPPPPAEHPAVSPAAAVIAVDPAAGYDPFASGAPVTPDAAAGVSAAAFDSIGATSPVYTAITAAAAADDPGAAANGTEREQPQQEGARVAAAELAADAPAELVESEATAAALAAAEAGNVNALLKRGHLCLVLDLDHTLVNSIKFSEAGQEMAERLRSLAAGPSANDLFELPHIQMWTKLRPGIHDFLRRSRTCFELWIHTNGSRSYAMAIAELLDPDGVLFGPRIIAQGKGDAAAVIDLGKRLKAGLSGRELVSIVVDDTSSVWSAHPENLFLVEPYIYFPGQRAVGIKSLLDSQRDEVAERGMLKIAMDSLMRVHARVFAALSAPPEKQADGQLTYARWDVPCSLQQERLQVLQGVRILFSRIIPLGEEPRQHALWQLAERFGASCTARNEETVTHLVTNTQHTLKAATPSRCSLFTCPAVSIVAGVHFLQAQWAREQGKFIVTASWLKCSCTLWKRAPEADFPVDIVRVGLPPA